MLSAAYITDHMRVHNQSQHHSCHLCNRSHGGARGAFGGAAGGVLLCQLCGVQCKTATQLQGHMGTHAQSEAQDGIQAVTVAGVGRSAWAWRWRRRPWEPSPWEPVASRAWPRAPWSCW
uniref:C2H2-type domain-containing protein n=1 Tax=Neogobius melanostomus TaxID=47308 RepID=A0A8C6TGR1_9GOBI